MKEKALKRYWKVYKIFFSNSVSYTAQFRAENIMRIFLNAAWILSLFLTVEIVFGQTNNLGGWQKSEVYLLMLVWVLADEVWGFLVGGNLQEIGELIRTGDMDFRLTKPISALFAISVNHIQIRSIMRFFVDILFIIFIILKFNIHLNIINIFIAIILLLAAMVILYAFEIVISSLSFWTIKNDAIYELYGRIFQFGKFPLDVFPKTLKIIFLTAIPVAFTTYVPTAALFGKWPWYGTIYVFAFAALSLFSALKFWNFALKKYSSASS